ncbi:biotin/methionine sulfoxide reductase [Bradyrhizobium sp. LM3.6]
MAGRARGRFHHAQSQVHRFLNIALGGYVRSVNSYSSGASSVLLPQILCGYEDITKRNVTWEQIAADTEIVLAFGGMALKNSMVAGGSISKHVERGAMEAAHRRGCEFILVSPLREDLPVEAGAEWMTCVPGTDTALMLGIVHTLVAENLHDQGFLDRYTEGWPVFLRYLTGDSDGQAKDAEWAAAICGVDADRIRQLARRLAGKRALITVSHSLQRAEHGEQPVWMGMVLAAALGQIGLPGGGYAYSLGAIGYYGRRVNDVPGPTLGQGRNAVRDFIPVARIADMLLNPGSTYRYNGETRTYPDIRLVYWAGGNPFHHHQDINRLRKAFAKVDTLVVHELAWTATARHADIVLPSTMTLEREDIGYSSNDPLMVAMHRIAEPFGLARDDYEIFADLADRLGAREPFTEGRTSRQWLEYLYEPTRASLEARGLQAPSFEEFWQRGSLVVPQQPDDGGRLRRFRDDPVNHALPTPSGRIEIFSQKIAGHGDADCPGHPVWLDKTDMPTPRRTVLPGRQPAGDAPAQPARFRRTFACRKTSRPRGRAHESARRRRARYQGRRHHPSVQRTRRLSRRGPRHRRNRAGNRAAPDRRLVRPDGPRRRRAALRARQPERSYPRHRHLVLRAGLHRPAHDGRGREVHRQSAPDPGVRSGVGP